MNEGATSPGFSPPGDNHNGSRDEEETAELLERRRKKLAAEVEKLTALSAKLDRVERMIAINRGEENRRKASREKLTAEEVSAFVKQLIAKGVRDEQQCYTVLKNYARKNGKTATGLHKRFRAAFQALSEELK